MRLDWSCAALREGMSQHLTHIDFVFYEENSGAFQAASCVRLITRAGMYFRHQRGNWQSDAECAALSDPGTFCGHCASMELDQILDDSQTDSKSAMLPGA